MRVTVDLGDIDLSTVVMPAGTDYDVYQDDDDDHTIGVARTHHEPVLLGHLVARELADRAGGAASFDLLDRAREIRDQEIRQAVRSRIIVALALTPAEWALAPVSELTLAQAIEAEAARQLHETDPNAMTRGQPSSVVQAIVATAVRAAFADLAAEHVARLVELVRADIDATGPDNGGFSPAAGGGGGGSPGASNAG